MSHIFINKSASVAVVNGQSSSAAAQVLAFHQKLPHYGQTPLQSLPQVAKELQLGHVLVKDESNRFGLPSFKILGASWAVYRALADRLRLDPAAFMDDNPGNQFWARLGSMARAEGLSLVTCTEGNWGRAVARMARYIGIAAVIYVPSFMPETTRVRIRSEGAELLVVDGSYDDGVAAARAESERNQLAILAMDIGWEGYTSFPGVCCTPHRSLQGSTKLIASSGS
jgi:diaminopropionate ammonia-lyase